MDFIRTYFKAASFSGISKVFAAFMALGVLWLVNAVAGKDGFGLAMLGYAMALILGHSFAAFFSNIMLYHTSRNHESPMISSALNWGVWISTALSVGVFFLAGPIAVAMDKPWAASVLQEFAWMIPPFVALSVLCEWCRARQKIITMVTYYEILPVGVRVLLLGGLYLSGYDSLELIANIYGLSYLLPFLVLAVQSKIRPSWSGEIFSNWNLKYGLHAMAAQFLNRSVLNVMTFVLGFFASAASVAEFALATRLAAFLNLPQLAIEQMLWPRLGAYLAKKQGDDLHDEFTHARRWTFGLCFLCVCGFVVLLPYVLPFFGEYKMAYGLILTLAVGSLFAAALGALDGLLAMDGHVRANMIMNAGGLAVMLAAFFILGASVIAAAVALVAGTAARSLIAYYYVRKLVKLP